jgi:aspartate/methionine/tyrosine aminotransferase
VTSRNETTLTALEAVALDRPLNLADGHAKLLPALQVLPEDLLLSVHKTSQAILEAQFLEAYVAASRESFDPDRIVLVPSASQGIDTVAKYLRQSGRIQVGLLEPVFDNVMLLLRRAGLEINPIPEDEEAVLEAVKRYDSVFLVIPNNPTGWVPSSEVLRRLSTLARRHDCLIVNDRTFRFFAEAALTSWAETRPIDWITIEDTGKTWSTLECKIAFLSSGRKETHRELVAIAQEVNLNVSPISLYLTADAIKRESGARRILDTVAINLRILDETLSPLGFERVSRPLSVALFRLPEHVDMTAQEFTQKLAQQGIVMLPGSQFYWATPSRGQSLIRVALARPVRLFQMGMAQLTTVISTGELLHA